MKSRKSGKASHVTAVYLFYRAGEPLVALAAGRDLPIEAEQLEGLLSVVGNFVETSVPGFARLRDHGDAVREPRDRRRARGVPESRAAVYDGVASEALKDDLLHTLQGMEERHWRHLRSWRGDHGERRPFRRNCRNSSTVGGGRAVPSFGKGPGGNRSARAVVDKDSSSGRHRLRRESYGTP